MQNIYKAMQFVLDRYRKLANIVFKIDTGNVSLNNVLFNCKKLIPFRHLLVIYNNLKISSLETMTCLCQQLSWQSSLVQRMAKGYIFQVFNKLLNNIIQL